MITLFHYESKSKLTEAFLNFIRALLSHSKCYKKAFLVLFFVTTGIFIIVLKILNPNIKTINDIIDKKL